MDQKPQVQAAITDPEDRDPNFLSPHLQFKFADVFGEPQAFRSCKCTWGLSKFCYNGSKTCCYVLLSVLCAPIAAFFMGCSFACLAYENIWCWTPTLRCFRIMGTVLRNFVRIVCEAIIIPICESLGYCFASMKVRRQNLPDGPDHREDILLI